jgi:acyl-CoA-dependent ceramide synthase
MLVPSSAFVLMMIPVILWANQWMLIDLGLMGPYKVNPFAWMIFPSHRLPNGLYHKGLLDFVFIGYYIIFWSFVRQFVTLYILRPMGRSLGIKGSKVMRFTEQGYAVFYFGIMGTAGILVMKQLPTWWYKTEHFWLGYPHREMTWRLKTYYLVQAAYWCQQTIILALKIEKPRKDFKELVAHHIVTLWLIGWSYGISLTYIGVSVFVTMDVSDIFLAVSYMSSSTPANDSSPSASTTSTRRGRARPSPSSSASGPTSVTTSTSRSCTRSTPSLTRSPGRSARCSTRSTTGGWSGG